MNQLAHVCVFIGLILGASAVGQAPKAITFTERDGFHSIAIPIAQLSADKLDHRKVTITAQGKIAEALCGMMIKIAPYTLPDRPGVTPTELECKLEFIGTPARKLYDELCQRFGERAPKEALRAHTFGLVEDTGSLRQITSRPIMIELIDLEHDDRYSEWYLTIDARKGIATLSEKNTEYRQPFLQAFHGTNQK